MAVSIVTIAFSFFSRRSTFFRRPSFFWRRRFSGWIFFTFFVLFFDEICLHLVDFVHMAWCFVWFFTIFGWRPSGPVRGIFWTVTVTIIFSISIFSILTSISVRTVTENNLCCLFLQGQWNELLNMTRIKLGELYIMFSLSKTSAFRKNAESSKNQRWFAVWLTSRMNELWINPRSIQD